MLQQCRLNKVCSNQNVGNTRLGIDGLTKIEQSLLGPSRTMKQGLSLYQIRVDRALGALSQILSAPCVAGEMAGHKAGREQPSDPVGSGA